MRTGAMSVTYPRIAGDNRTARDPRHPIVAGGARRWGERVIIGAWRCPRPRTRGPECKE
ncbi:hypothetical protein Aglo03_15560 [Actinokineospora globicatena]|uniref:Uncharacterized protein n=1 Tax=Actinokineospora globicatena TaxID=103729 RepID=A0A9W6V5T0_9PSEU|nr:hypothetical protein Aglo03_15560 [Actinokineospora globicatena]